MLATEFVFVPSGNMTGDMSITVKNVTNYCLRKMSSAYSSSFTVEGEGIVKGDVNGDGDIFSSDALLILQFVTELTSLTQAQQTAADVNSDGAVNSYDALLVLQFSTNLITEF